MSDVLEDVVKKIIKIIEDIWDQIFGWAKHKW